MQEILTNSGAVLHVDEANPNQQRVLKLVTGLFGGAVSTTNLDDSGDGMNVMLAIADQAIIGTVMTGKDGKNYILMDSGWYCDGTEITDITSVAMRSAQIPGGSAWAL